MEIGSIFELNPENLFFDEPAREIVFPFMKDEEWKLEFFNTGRAAIEAYLLLNKNTNRVWLPAFICSSVIDAMKRAGKELCYYPITRSLDIDLEYLKKCDMHHGDVLYVVQYFGVSMSTECIDFIELQQKNGVLVFEDITMSLLSEKNRNIGMGDAVLGSVRKWDALPDGAFLATRGELPKMRKDVAAYDYTLYYFAAQVMKSLYLKSSQEYDKKCFLSLSSLGIDALFSDYTIRDMSEISYRLLRSKTWEKEFVKRRENYEILYQMLSEIPQITLLDKCKDNMIPLGMFVVVEDRDGLLNYLIKNDIYCNVHWRENEVTELFENTEYLSKHCITIPCDQRYGKEEMHYIYKIIKSYWE